jgi:PAS domain S-box-containing protein
MTSGFAKGLGLQFALATVILLVAGACSYRNVNESARTAKRLEDTYRVLHGIDRALTLIKDAESGQQGYLLTGNATYLNPYEAARTRLNHEIDSLAQLTAGNLSQQQRVAELRPLTIAKLAELEQAIELRRDGKVDAALEIVNAGHGKKLMQQIQSLIAQMEEDENSQLGLASSSNALGALQAFAAATVANLVLMIFAFRFVMRELGERRRSEAALARLASIVEYSEDAIISHELDGTITSWNAGAERLYGYSAQETLGKPISMIVPPERAAQTPDVLDQIRRGRQVAACEAVDKRKDGTPIPVSLSVSPIKDASGLITGVSAIIRDISERKRAEAALLQRTRDLQAQTKALEKARQEADRSNRVKSEFLTNMSHELRTPMNSIMGFTRRLLKKLGSTLPERELDALQTVDRNAKHLLTLINNILDLSKIEAGKLEVHRTSFDLSTVIREAADQTAPLVDGKPVEVKLNLPRDGVALSGDRVMLTQVVVNLLSNAIKFTERGTVSIVLDVVADERLGAAARIVVRDTGVGIKSEDRSRLFQEFSQIDTGGIGRAGGTGLGLVISARFVQLHGGRIDVGGEYGEGSEFTVLLPLCRHDVSDQSTPGAADGTPMTSGSTPCQCRPAMTFGPDEPAAAVREFAHGSSSNGWADSIEPRGQVATILCVDDEPDVLKFLRFTFEDVGYKVVLAADHDAALEAANLCQPDLICLDLCMPEKDGYAVMKALRGNPALARVPVVVLSISREEARVLAAGAHCYLAKPVDSDDLVVTVRELLALETGSVLIVEDDPDTRRLLSLTLAEHGLQSRTAANGREALDRLAEATPDAIVLDLVMPVMDGFAFLERVQLDPVWSKVPVVILTSKTLDPAEFGRLNQSVAAILTKGRRDTELVVDAILRCVRPRCCQDAAGLAL